jgi:glycosyltransferase involved in cell wall biosynthesis
MNVFIPNLHHVLTASLCRVFDQLGMTVLVPEVDDAAQRKLSKYRSPLAGAFDFRAALERERLPNCRIVTLQALPDLDVGLVIVAGQGVQRSVLKHLMPLLERRHKTFLAFFCGNELPRYRWDLVANLLCADERSWQQFGHRVPNAARYYPWIDYGRFAWQGPSDARKLVTCIGDFETRYPRDAATARTIVGGIDALEHELIDKIPHDAVATRLRAAAASLHIKSDEGYGYAVIESLACGRPVIAPRRYVAGRAMARWCIDGESALLFDRIDEAQQQLRRFFADADFRHALQSSAAATVRRAIDNDEQREVLRRFLERLQPQPDKSLRSHLLDLRHFHA